MEISKKTRSEVRDETLWAMKEAIDNARGFVCHVSWLTDDGVIKQNDKSGHSWGGVGNQGKNPIVSGTEANPSEIENDAANASQVVEETEYGSFMGEYYPDETNSMTVNFDDSDDEEEDDDDDENENEQNN